jgi:hypothetical protein
MADVYFREVEQAISYNILKSFDAYEKPNIYITFEAMVSFIVTITTALIFYRL